ncbi:Serpentine Receptor, class BC (Class B-like) [Caenorhabditis elegans]|uniref:Serpentine Receptor, class BC (Class B-like) n=1 Tax=Caenorhabditis elegans TaxID=6239 RepID=Q19912_CAEEL|nr:Serpentine Receptor, class BC (Class B-like) [Caenorhabditis elegans]CCD70271.1 Serpentine Receptor, class BC (Class B-like) [Caenorhabditis elegans]|eukprot:NP_500516.1 Serpentine Receptor, class BC (class B-like) [Caenorhabditis elegans]
MALIVTVSTLIVVFLCETICYLNLRLLFTIFYLKKIAFKPDLTLVYLILAGDAGYSFCVGLLKIYTLAITFSKALIVKNLILFLLIASILFGVIRTTLIFSIALFRFIAIYFQISYHNNSHKTLLCAISVNLCLLIFFDQYMMFGYCNNVIDVPLVCDNSKCAYNQCYFDFWMFREKLVYICISMLSAVLAIRLFVWKFCTKNRTDHMFSKATQIALLDSAVVIFSNILPVFVSSQLSNIDFLITSSMTTVCRNLGLLISTVLIYRIFMRDKKLVSVLMVTPSARPTSIIPSIYGVE